MSDEAEVHEIVIIKRAHGGGHDEHHGGVWKIAFADFMTAMMAFFLVMWLISANDKTKAVVARYFNPVQLVDATPQRPGLNDPKVSTPSVTPSNHSSGEGRGKDAKEGVGQNPVDTSDRNVADAEKAGKKDEAQLFKDPYAVLAELSAKNTAAQQAAQKATAPAAPSEGTQGGSGAVGALGGEAYRDPFEPVAVPPPSSGAVADDAADPAPSAPAAAPPLAAKDPSDDKQTAEIRAKIAAIMGASQAAAPAGADPHVAVKQTGEGVLIDITDGANFSMFASASALPAPKLVGLMEKVGKLLKAEKGRIVIRGFTDSRPFKSDTYDNWRLSSARAAMAHYMLVRGGLDEARVDSVEGYADRHPKNVKDPNAPENRRVEILIRNAAP